MIDRSRSEYSIMNILTGFGGYFLNTLLGYICRIVFVQCLNADYLGINGLLTNILSMLSLAELGIGGAIGYALYKPIAEKDNEKIASLMGFYGKAYRIIGCVVALLGLFMIGYIVSFFYLDFSVTMTIFASLMAGCIVNGDYKAS